MSVTERTHPSPASGKALPAITGASLFASLGTLFCCAIPVTLLSLGIATGLAGGLFAFAPYRMYFLIGAVAFQGIGYWSYFRANRACVADATCTTPPPGRLTLAGLVFSSLLTLVGVGFFYIEPYLM